MFLVLDTSLPGLNLGLVRLNDNTTVELLDSYHSPHAAEAAAHLPTLCQSLIEKQKLSWSQVTTLLVDHGPGSFTGIKIGLAFASGMKRGRPDLKVYGLSGLSAVQSRLFAGRALVLGATQTGGYLALDNGAFATLDLLQAQPLRHATEGAAALELNSLPQRLGIIEGWPRLEAALTAAGLAFETIPMETLRAPLLLGLAQDFIANSAKLSEGDLRPVYLRKSAPEEKLEQANRSS